MSELGQQALRTQAQLKRAQEEWGKYLDEKKRYDEMKWAIGRDLRAIREFAGPGVKVVG